MQHKVSQNEPEEFRDYIWVEDECNSVTEYESLSNGE